MKTVGVVDSSASSRVVHAAADRVDWWGICFSFIYPGQAKQTAVCCGGQTEARKE